MDDLLALDSHRPTVSCLLPSPMQEVNTPLCWQVWDQCLASHPDQEFRHYIVRGIHYGFRVGFNYAHELKSTSRNLASVKDHSQVVRDYTWRWSVLQGE